MSERFGEITYTQNDVLSFPRGLPAFENSRSWVLVGDEDNAIKFYPCTILLVQSVLLIRD